MKVSYETIIGKSESKIDIFPLLENKLVGQRILVTGAGGSIGSKIVSKLAEFSNLKILATDRDENRLHSLSLEVLGTALFLSSDFKVLDVRDQIGVFEIVRSFQPTIIIHAAALKHLAILEKQPREAYLTNVIGTSNILNAAEEIGVKSFLNISTDKAANPVSILGKSKAIGEILTTIKRRKGLVNYTSVRFGNVFNSRGSVIETFTKQIQLNLPVTLTHPDVKRFFMKIEEAANLSLASLILAKGDVHILDMGEPVKLSYVVERLIATLGGKSQIVVVGLREGEKLEEELWSISEKVFDSNVKGIKYLNFGNGEAQFSQIDLVRDLSSDEEARKMIDRVVEDSRIVL